MKTVMAEFSGRRAGYFRPKPLLKIGGRKPCQRCGKHGHLGITTCEVKALPRNWRDVITEERKDMGENTKDVPAERLAAYLDGRKTELDADYERHKNDRQMKSIIAGRLMEIEKMRQAFMSAGGDPGGER